MAQGNRVNFYSGTSGLVLPVPNKLSFPPEYHDKSRLAYYASLFNTIEINSSFKKLPMKKTVEKWAASVPDYFQFTLKCLKGVTHNKGLLFNPDDIHSFFHIVASVGDKKGCLLFQFPGKLTSADTRQLEYLLQIIRQSDPEHQWKVSLEFRNSSWYHPDIYLLLHHYRAGMVLHDMPLSAPPVKDLRQNFMYVRFHGPEKGYRGSYSDEFLSGYAILIKVWIKEGKSVYVYFNNTLGNASGNLIRLNRLVHL